MESVSFSHTLLNMFQKIKNQGNCNIYYLIYYGKMVLKRKVFNPQTVPFSHFGCQVYTDFLRVIKFLFIIYNLLFLP